MRLVIAISLTIAVFVVFWVALFNQMIWVFLCTFLLWTPLAWWTGATWVQANPTKRLVLWIARREGIVSAADEQQPRSRKERVRSGVEFQ